jgi:protein gp37
VGEISKIAWCDATFNPVIGCQKISEGCRNCYAEAMMDKRYHRVDWGQMKTETTTPSVGTRVRTSATYWAQPARWARKARRLGTRPKVFCASLSDVFDNQWDGKDRLDLWMLIRATPELDWLLLTKRPENIEGMLPVDWPLGFPNVWLGTTCEDQAAFDKRWPILQEIPARVRFVSYEPALGPLTINFHRRKPDWIICGGESGQGHRAMRTEWAYRLMDECEREAVPFFMKQLSGTNPARVPIPEDLLVRQFPVGAR